MKRLWNQFVNPIAQRVTNALRPELNAQARALDVNRMMLGQLHSARVGAIADGAPLHGAEFSVYSQSGEDGIIEYLISRIDVPDDVFVEFGVQDYLESNTRFLLRHRNWRGLVLDGGTEYIASICKEELCWRYDLTAVQAFITAENINALIRDNGITGDIGLLSVDIDGNDYWVWKAIDVVTPRVVVCEYNSVFGVDRAVTVPYYASFDRTRGHYSNLFFGASLRALCLLAREKGYAFVGCTTSGSNAFFVRRDCMARLRELTPDEGYVLSRVRESRNASGALSYLHGEDRLREIAHCEVVDVTTGERLRVGDLRR